MKIAQGIALTTRPLEPRVTPGSQGLDGTADNWVVASPVRAGGEGRDLGNASAVDATGESGAPGALDVVLEACAPGRVSCPRRGVARQITTSSRGPGGMTLRLQLPYWVTRAVTGATEIVRAVSDPLHRRLPSLEGEHHSEGRTSP